MVDVNLIKKLRDMSGAGISACQKALSECDNDIDKAFDLLRKQGISKASAKSDRETAEGLCAIITSGSAYAIVKLSCETDFVARTDKFQELLLEITNCALKNKINNLDALLNCDNNGSTIADVVKNGIATLGENMAIKQVVYREIKDGEKFAYYIHNKVSGKDNIGSIISATIVEDCKDENALDFAKKINMHISAMKPLGLEEKDIPGEVLDREKAVYEEQVASLNKPADIVKKMIEGKIRKFYEENVLMKQFFAFDDKKRLFEVINEFNKTNSCSFKIVSFDRVSLK